ncbi:MAG: helix-turn-helix transcriptional regulator [Proteobacteria bacterium]|nr:helix-turn-helix transcriptional regulator [Pseudomonadota bacterium]
MTRKIRTSRPRRASEFDVEIGKRIRRERERAKLSQSELARLLNVSYQQVQKYENGLNRASAGRVVQIAQILETPIMVFFEGLDAEGVHRKGAPSLTNADILNFSRGYDVRRLLESLERLRDPAARKRVLDFVHSLEATDV